MLPWSARHTPRQRPRSCSTHVLLPPAAHHCRVLEDAVHRPHPIAPTDLLAFSVRAAAVRDANLVDAPAGGRDLGGDFGLEAEAILLDLDRLDDLATERLVAGLHVAE